AVDHGRIRLQLHPEAQAVDEHGADQRSLFGPAGLLLDDGGEYQSLIGRGEREVRGAPFPLRREVALHEAVGAAQYPQVARPVAEIISVRKEPALRRRLTDAEALRDVGIGKIADLV